MTGAGQGVSQLRAHLGGVPGDEVVHRLLRGQFADRRQHAEGVAAQQDDVLGVGSDARDARVGNVLDWV